MITENIRETNELYILFPINGKLESERRGEDIYGTITKESIQVKFSCWGS